ncbi:MAG: insulinase family protein [Spirochaetales bacterium]|nr:insulinase family protein [Spirochaetales bacterium]
MKKVLPILAILLAMFLLFSCTSTDRGPDPEKQFPIDPKVTTGQLENGLKYYIRQNGKPEKTAELWLAVKAGSINEDEDQRGLAHFCEHMAFNGTTDFPGNSIISFLEHIGMKFGPEVNAYTTFERTVYMLQVPMDNPEFLETAIHILSQWAAFVSYDPEEVEKERGVITEEWRLGRGAQARLRDKHLPVLYHNSLFAERIPIGDIEIIENADRDTLVRFYKDWYRPDLMSVIAVGDFDTTGVENLIRQYFSPLKNPQKERPRVRQKVPPHKETLVSIVSDPEMQYPIFEYYKKYPDYKYQDQDSYRSRIAHWLIMNMIGIRLDELREKENTPVLSVSMSEDHYLETLRWARLAWIPDSDRIDEAMNMVLETHERVRRFGFFESELERAKTELLGLFRKDYNERETTHSYNFLFQYLNNFLFGNEIPGVEWKYRFVQDLLPQITLAEIRRESEVLFSDGNRVLMVSIPDNLTEKMHSGQELRAMIEQIKSVKMAEEKPANLDGPLLAEQPAPGSIVSEKTHESIGVSELVLSNGMRVILKPTDFRADEIRFSAFSPGGASLVDDGQYMSSQVSVDLVTAGGIGNFRQSDLQKKLSGKVVSVEPFLEELTEGFSGNSTKADLETAFQLIYLYFTDPRIDRTAMQNLLDRINSVYKNRETNPEAYFSDQFEYLLNDRHFRYRPVTSETLGEINPDDAAKIFRERFADAGDFTFVFTGSFTPEEIKPLITTYLASLPDLPGSEKWMDRHEHYPQGHNEKDLFKGKEDKSMASLAISGPYNWDINTNYYLQTLKDVLEIALRENIREDESGTYDINITVSYSHYPDQEYLIRLDFGCDPGRADELIVKINALLTQARTAIDDDILARVLETQKKSLERSIKENWFWIGELQKAWFHGYAPEKITEMNSLISNFDKTELQRVAEKYLDPQNYLQVVLFPEKYETLPRP